MRSNKIFPKVLLAAGIILLVLILQFQSQIRGFWLLITDSIKIQTENFFQTGPGPIRNPPLSLLQQETDLQLYIGEPFRDFSAGEWAEFWKLIYGTYPMDPPERPGLPRRQRQMTEDEIADELARRYPDVFTFFQDTHWRSFFGILFKK